MEWWNDRFFTSFLQKFDEHEGNNSDRRWMLYQMLRLVDDVPGDTAECGVYRGCASWLICHRNAQIDRRRRTHFLFDSFEGLSAPGPEDGSHWTKGALAAGEAVVRQNLADFASAIVCVKGWIPQTFSQVSADRQFCFVHIDVDLYEPTLESLRFFYPRMPDGGIILCDDYGFTTCPGATRALDEFFSDKREKIVGLCSGGGLVIKGMPAAVRDLPQTTSPAALAADGIHRKAG